MGGLWRARYMVGAAGLEPTTLCLEGSAAQFLGFMSAHIFHSLTLTPGICFRSE
jgi:hypothetical protein